MAPIRTADTANVSDWSSPRTPRRSHGRSTSACGPAGQTDFGRADRSRAVGIPRRRQVARVEEQRWTGRDAEVWPQVDAEGAPPDGHDGQIGGNGREEDDPAIGAWRSC